MFSAIFEMQPRPDQWHAYLGHASLSDWRDEKAVVRWRMAMHHHHVQEKGRREMLRDYHLRVGQVTADTNVRVIRDYGMFDRREAPRYYPEQRRHVI